MRKLITIGELANLFKVETSQIRYYEKEGLLTSQRDRESDYRLYDFMEMNRLEVILLLRDLGLSIDKIKTMIDGYEIEDYRTIVEDLIKDLDGQIKTIRQRKKSLGNSLRFLDEFKPNELIVNEHNEKKLYVDTSVGSSFPSIRAFYDYHLRTGLDYSDYSIEIYFFKKEGSVYTALSKHNSSNETITLPAGKYITIYKEFQETPLFDADFDGVLEEVRAKGYEVTGEIYVRFSIETLIINNRDYVVYEVKLKDS